jgi:type I restriction enzyme M protein
MNFEIIFQKHKILDKLVEAIIIIPRNTFYTTDISVTLWILNKNKKQRTDNTKDLPAGKLRCTHIFY